MRVFETIERDCCHPTSDLRTFAGGRGPNVIPGRSIKFCVHCGQLWVWTRQPGEMDAGWERATVTEIDF